MDRSPFSEQVRGKILLAQEKEWGHQAKLKTHYLMDLCKHKTWCPSYMQRQIRMRLRMCVDTHVCTYTTECV